MANTLARIAVHRMLRQEVFSGTKAKNKTQEDAERHIREISGVVNRAAHAAVMGTSDLLEESKKVPWWNREFFWEGVGLGNGARTAFSLRGRNPDERRVTDTYRVITYTGYGFWNGLARAHHAPEYSFRREDWREVEDFPRNGPLLAGGVAFGLICAKRKFDTEILEKLIVPVYPGWGQGAIHGAGRALSFLYPGDAESIENLVAEHPAHREALLEGVGVALSFTHLDDGARQAKMIGSYSRPENHRAVWRGAVAGYNEVEDQEHLRTDVFPKLDDALRRGIEEFRPIWQTIEPGWHYYDEVTAKVRQFEREFFA